MIITIDNQQDAAVMINLLLVSCTCFGRCLRPSSEAYHCNYSFWYCPPMFLLAGVAYWLELSSTQYATPTSYSKLNETGFVNRAGLRKDRHYRRPYGDFTGHVSNACR